MNILMVHIRFAEYDRCSGDLRLTNILRVLAKRNRVTLHILHKPSNYLTTPENEKYAALMKELGIDVRAGGLRAHLREQKYDVIVIEFWFVARHLFDEIRALQPDARIVVDTENVYFYANEFKARALGLDERSHEFQQQKEAELATYARADFVIATTEEDQAVLLRENSSLRVASIPNIHQIPQLPETEKRERDSLIFVGNFSNNPANVDAMIGFCRETLPLIRQRIPAVRLSIVGNAPTPEVKALQGPGIEVTGYVPDTAPYLERAAVSVCPLRFGAGLKGKIGEAMSHGVPVVTTSIGVQGMRARVGEDILVGDSPEEFANCVVRLLEDANYRVRVGRNGRDYIVGNYSFEAVSGKAEHALREAVGTPIKRYGQVRRMALRSNYQLADLLDQHLWWRLKRPA